MRLIPKAKIILERLEANGHEAFLVGGCVRDLLLNRPLHDADICTSARPEQIQQVFEHVIPTGLKHGTVTVLVDDIPFEVTTYRLDAEYSDHRHPQKVHFVHSLQQDLSRRDFTINALVMDRQEHIHDYFQGREDLQRKMIRTVGPPEERFREDALRILRAVRFSAQLGFDIEAEAQQHMQSCAQLLQHISRERITAEFEKTMAAPFANRGLLHYGQSAIGQTIAPFHRVQDAFRRLQKYPLYSLTIPERWALFLSLVGEGADVSAFLQGLRLTKSFAKQVRSLLKHVHQSEGYTQIEQFTPFELFEWGEKSVTSVLKINQLKQRGCWPSSLPFKVRQTFRTFPLQSKQDLQVTGKDLLVGSERSAGPWIQKTLHVLRKAVFEGKVDNEKEQLLAYIRECDRNES